jgi:hypothetical protein
VHRRAIDWTLDDIYAVVESGEQENVSLEYKASLAVGEWPDRNRNELAKDLCAFANSAGGIIVIGVGELEHKPSLIDGRVDTRLVSKEAIESALAARVSPRIDNLTIKEIPNPGLPFYSYFVIGIPRSMRAPHMCNPYHRYYKRYNFECVPMEHYEVEDVRRRQSEPSLVFTCQLQPLDALADGRRQYLMLAGVQNEGSVTARDVLVRIYLPRSCAGPISWSPNGTNEATTYNGIEVYRFDAYVRDNAGPIPIFPRDDQPYMLTRGASRRIILHLPPDPPADLTQAHIIAQIFADGMRMRSAELLIAELIETNQLTIT